MSLSNAYNCDVVLGDHVCIPCNTNREFGRVRGSATIDEDYLPDLMVDPTDLSKWAAGIAAGKIVIFPETAGTYDPGDPQALKGYGNRTKTNGPRSQKLVFNDPTYAENYQFYNSIADATNKVMAYKTSSLIHIADVPASIFAKDPVADDLKSELDWQVTCDWESKNLPSKHDATALESLFKCSF